MQTYLGLTQRTLNGRFLYGRVNNYRLNSCLACLRNPTDALGSMTPTSGPAPLTVNATAPTFPVNTLTPGIDNNWPAPAAGGMSSPLASGGIAVQGSGYARIDTPPAITPTQTWVWGDGSADSSVASASVTPHVYAIGEWVPSLVCNDALKRSNTEIFATIMVAPTAPVGLVAVGGTTQISLSWTATAGAITYKVYRSTTSGGSLTLIASGLASPAYIDTGLPAGTSRYYKVSAVDADGESNKSAEATAITLCAKTTNLIATGTTTEIDLAWDAMTGAATYNVYRSTTSGGAQTLIASGVAVTTYADTPLAEGTTRYYKVAAVNASGIGPQSDEATAITLPAQVANVVATGTTTEIDLTWDATPSATSYDVYRSDTSGGAQTLVGSGVLVTNFADTPLPDGTSRFYKVLATNAAGDGPQSAEATAITLCAKTTSLVATGGALQIGLTWDAMTGAATYNVYRSATSGGAQTLIASGVATNSYTDTPLLAAATWFYKVAAVNASGIGPQSDEATATTDP